MFQITEESRNDDQIPHDCTLPRINSKKQTLLEGDSTPVHMNIRNEDSAHNNYICRCKALSEIPSTIFPPFYRKVPSFIGQHTCEMSFIQAIVWLKSVTTCISQIPVEKLQQLFDEQRNMCDNHNYDKSGHSKDVHVELSLTPHVNETPSVHEMLNYSESYSELLSSLKSIFDSPCNIISPVIYDKYKLDTESENTQNETVSFVSSSTDRNETISQLSKLETSTDYIMINEKEREALSSKSYISPNLSEDSLLDLNDLIKECGDVQKHQSFEYEETSLKRSNKGVNNEIIEDENTSKNDAGISNEHRSVLSARSQSIESIFKYCDIECTPLSINDIIGKMGTPDSHNSTNFTNYLSNINFSQIMSPVSCKTPREQNNANNLQTDRVQSKALHDCNNDKYQIDDNNLCTMIDSSTAKKEDHNSAYSTSKIETLNYDTAITTKSANKCTSVANIEHHYNLRSHKKKKETASRSVIQQPVRKERLSVKKQSSSKKCKVQPTKNLTKKKKKNTDGTISANWLNFTIESELLNSEHVILTSVKVILSTLCDKRTAQKYALHRCWKDSLEEQAINTVLNIVDILRKEKKPDVCVKEIENTIIETLDEMITSVELNEANIEYHYNLRFHKKKKDTASPPVIQKSVCKRRLSAKKQSLSEKRKLQSTKNLTKNNNFQTDRMQSKQSLHDYNDDNFKYQSDNNLCTSMSDSSAVGKEDHKDYDSAYSTSKIETLNDDTAITTKFTTAKKCTSVNIEHHYNLRSQKKKDTASPPVIQKSDHEDYDSAYSTSKIEKLNYDTAITTKSANKCTSVANIEHHYNLRSHKKKKETASRSVIQQPVRKERLSVKKQSSSKKCKVQPTKNLTKKKKKNTDGTISANWLNFTIESELLNSEHVILTSVKVILSTLCDKRTAQKYALHRCWKDSLEEQAINTVLNIVDILRKEKKPDVCVKEIENTIIETLDEMITSVELNEFCSLLSICVKTINYLIAMLQALQQVLIDATMENERTVEIEIDQLYLVCYTLDIALRTYRTLVSRDKQFQRAENAILYVGDLWKMRYRVENEELEDHFDLDATEKRWMNVLKTFTETSVKHLIQFTNVSYSLYHDILIST
ncbi:hypothetical protein EAG_03760 [Camponotus floridanus]|uniref:Uncharacterized protein n=1 Tax=Camponotus floridanus TaxID=104421 RepID=E2B165_CAMFO|nr:hypothetical protein EAG_03760 [Camponotus floridanus]